MTEGSDLGSKAMKLVEHCGHTGFFWHTILRQKVIRVVRTGKRKQRASEKGNPVRKKVFPRKKKKKKKKKKNTAKKQQHKKEKRRRETKKKSGVDKYLKKQQEN
eukprot:TRINITY_DN16008_c0_g1_i2.p3 TRINITY_DN16008_c0_g1~~TRINITY_DN16008_c0_g1_i2.p3  ORF type:complete len:104 (-),score=30.66 TRINITY_DN16008_c0_g1_i2:65-376(-)